MKEINANKIRQQWHKDNCDCEGSMKGENIMGQEIDCPRYEYIDMEMDDFFAFLKSLGLKVIDDSNK